MAEHKRPRKRRKKARGRKFLPDADEIPQVLDEVDVPDMCIGGVAR